VPNVKLRRQTPVKGGRYYHSAGFIEEVESAIERERAKVRRQFGYLVGRSFVIANCVAYALNVTMKERYDSPPDGKRRGRNGKSKR
jgi:hypothetical protein